MADGARLLREGNGTAFVLLRVKPTEPPPFKRNLDAAFAATASARRFGNHSVNTWIRCLSSRSRYLLRAPLQSSASRMMREKRLGGR